MSPRLPMRAWPARQTRTVFARLAVLTIPASTLTAQHTPVTAARLDHVPIAVRDLDAAATSYTTLGFTLAPGQVHPNSIRNTFVKMQDGTFVELISATEARDSLSQWYLELLDRREGGAFLALATDSVAAVASYLTNRDAAFSDTGAGSKGFRTVAFVEPEPLRRVFFIQYTNRSVDPDTVVTHGNTAVGVAAAWLVVRDIAATTHRLENLGWSAGAVVSMQPLNALGRAFSMAGGSLILVTPTDVSGITASLLEQQGESIMGMTVMVEDVMRARQVVARGVGRRFPVGMVPGRGRSFFVPPGLARGMWIEFLEPEA
jgi:hypothetical protein